MIFKYSGRIAPGSPHHTPATAAQLESGELIAPTYVYDVWSGKADIPKYAPTTQSAVNGFNPAGDAGGAFMSSQYQPNNNCYAYSCCIATNTFPQPGRATPGSVDMYVSTNFTAANVQSNAVLDGLVYVGTAITDLPGFQAPGPGHFVALLFSPPQSNIGGDKDANWMGDYHWVRCDDAVNYASWSQKDGDDQVTNFDFAGQPITNPATANWTVNLGPISPKDKSEYTAQYNFVCFMWVANKGVNIL